MKPKKTLRSLLEIVISPLDIVNLKLPARLFMMAALITLGIECLMRVEGYPWPGIEWYVRFTVVLWVWYVVGAVLGLLERQNALLVRQTQKLDALLMAVSGQDGVPRESL